MVRLAEDLTEARETAAQLESRVGALEGVCAIMVKHNSMFHGKAAQIQAAVRRWRIKLHLGSWFRKSVERRLAAAEKVAQEEMFLGEVRRQLDMEEAAKEAQQKEQGMVALEAVWAKRAEGWRAECEHLREREERREHRRQLVERNMMAEQQGFVCRLGGSSVRQSTRAAEIDALWEEMDEDDLLASMDGGEIRQWWVEGMEYEDEDEW